MNTYRVGLTPSNMQRSFEGEFQIRKKGESTPKTYSNGFRAALSLVQRIRAGVMTEQDIVFEWNVSSMPKFMETYQRILDEKKVEKSELESIAQQ